ncbi:unnamed protein product [Mytilus coruscus]|uniref:C2H2-type domain-containing protein n=1 Tax=Mytilus coruscus TaxID=42192 RepID=A0A6J8BMU5_MYTCO|nr:unnamed protein product [Mytilus coruscus]
MDQKTVHIHEGLQIHQKTQNLSCVSNTKESVTMEETGLPIMHPWKEDAVHNQDRLQPHLEHVEPQKLSVNYNHDNTNECCIKEEPGLTTIHPLEQNAEAIPEASKIQAQLCDYNFSTKHSLERHNAEKHSELAKQSFVCEICHESFLHKTNLVRHIATHKQTNSFSCLTCSKTFDREFDLWAHFKLCKKDAFQESENQVNVTVDKTGDIGDQYYKKLV